MLEALKRQTYKNIEIIVVDNKSDDGTLEVAKQFTEKVFDRGPERSAQRNFGIIDKSEGEYVIYLDADMVPSKNLIESCVEELCKKPSLGALYIPEMIIGKSIFTTIRAFERQYYSGTPIDAVRFFKKSEFLKVGGLILRILQLVASRIGIWT